MWMSSWRLGSRRSSTPSRSSSPLRLLRPALIVILESTKGVRVSRKTTQTSTVHKYRD
ncbi:hypothetical protein Taro_049049, partial [Colocasia esculenta]|nr:hypothetical protein [Colocasia esculenta]